MNVKLMESIVYTDIVKKKKMKDKVIMKVISDIRIYRSFLRIGDRSYMQKRLQEMCVDVLVL